MKIFPNFSLARSFTLIELLVVITIIAILSALLMPALRGAKESANSVKCVSNLHQLGIAFEMYGQQHSKYPWCRDFGGAAHWTTRISPFLQTPGSGTWSGGNTGQLAVVLQCPSRKYKSSSNQVWSSYACNRQLLGNDLGGAMPQYPRLFPFTERPSEVMLAADCSVNSRGESNPDFWQHPEFQLAYNAATAELPVDPGLNMDSPDGGLTGQVRWRHRGGSAANFLFPDGRVEAIKSTEWKEKHVKINPPLSSW